MLAACFEGTKTVFTIVLLFTLALTLTLPSHLSHRSLIPSSSRPVHPRTHLDPVSIHDPTPAIADDTALRPRLRRNLGGDPMSSSSTPTTDTASATNLFPTNTASSASSSSSSSQNPTVYYFVVSDDNTHSGLARCCAFPPYPLTRQFLGVLVILLCVAACLAYRAYRMRRRYRTARQMAIARGEPFMAGREDYWGLGGLSGWTSEGADRLAVERAAMEWEARRLGRKGRWEKTPALWESEVGDKEDQAKDLEDALVSARFRIVAHSSP
jgi:hypothetical protein